MLAERVGMYNKSISLLAITTILLTAIGLVVVPSLEQADAANIVSESKNKGKQGELKSDGKRQGKGGSEGGGGGGCQTCG
ncbi:MAG TPA: hypothetical protein VJU13_04880 [Candidatus Nitrosocosmicus sp.]|nr:hypothetical protein [Candidatus Nitrosocosmicus sp.]